MLPGVEELLALGEVRRAAETGPWEVVVVDCGPTAETLRLLGLPEAISGYLERLFPAHRRAVRGLLTNLAGAGREARPGVGPHRRRARRAGRAAARPARACSPTTPPPRSGWCSRRSGWWPPRPAARSPRSRCTGSPSTGWSPTACCRVRRRRCAGLPRAGCASGTTSSRSCSRELSGLPVPLRTAAHTAAEPTGVPALLEIARSLYGDADPAAPVAAPAGPLLQVRRTAGSGTSADSAFELVMRLPGAADGTLDLTRVDDDLAVTAGGTRRMVALPSVLRRCTVTGAHLDGDDLCVAFAPDPAAVAPVTARGVGAGDLLRRPRRAERRAARARAHRARPDRSRARPDARRGRAAARARDPRRAARSARCAPCSPRCAVSGPSSRRGWPSRPPGCWRCCGRRWRRAAPRAPAEPSAETAPPAGRRVQHIRVDRAAR